MAFLDSFINQTAVYWAPGTNDGYGGITYGSPSEITCRWEASDNRVTRKDGEEITSTGTIWTSTELAVDGLLFLGGLDDLSTADEADPEPVEEARLILNVQSIPSLDATETVYVVSVK